MPAPENPVLLAVIGAAHGIKGEVRVKTFTGDPLALAGYGPLAAKDGRRFDITDIRPAGAVLVVRFKGVNERAAAEALNGTELFVDRAALPAADEGEFLHDDLLGLSVQDETGAALGEVTAVHNFGGGDILELTMPGRKGVLIPFTHAAVPVVDIAAGVIRIDSMAAGLIDDDSDGGPENPPTRSGKATPVARPRGPRDAGGNR